MMDVIRAAGVIARRDYVASVFSRTFLLFLIGPLLPILAAMLFAAAGADGKAGHPVVAVIADAADGSALQAARRSLADRLGDDALPALRIVPPEADADRQNHKLLADPAGGVVALVRGGLHAPQLIGSAGAVGDVEAQLALIWDGAHMVRALADADARPPRPTAFAVRTVKPPAGDDSAQRALTARLGQLVLMMLTMILAGMLLSNLIEEKSNKVIEVLAAAVPVDAIFLGKLMAMLAMSLTGIAIWGGAAALIVRGLFPAFAAALPPPAIGWGMFVMLGVIYFIACYLLLGALFLGIGAQAASVREVQTLSMPVTMGQLGVVALASSVVVAPDGGLATVAMVFPWSSPFAMIARAAQSPAILPHLLAIGWQALWIGLIIRIAARRFRVSVLKSGGPRRRAGLFRRRIA